MIVICRTSSFRLVNLPGTKLYWKKVSCKMNQSSLTSDSLITLTSTTFKWVIYCRIAHGHNTPTYTSSFLTRFKCLILWKWRIEKHTVYWSFLVILAAYLNFCLFSCKCLWWVLDKWISKRLLLIACILGKNLTKERLSHVSIIWKGTI